MAFFGGFGYIWGYEELNLCSVLYSIMTQCVMGGTVYPPYMGIFGDFGAFYPHIGGKTV